MAESKDFEAFEVPNLEWQLPVTFAVMASYSSKASSSIAVVRFTHLMLGDTSLTYGRKADSCFAWEVGRPSSDADTTQRCSVSSADSPGTAAAATIDCHTD